MDPPARQGSPFNGGSRASVFGAVESENKEEGEGESSQVSFGDRLRASKDAEDDDSDEAAGGAKLELTEQEGEHSDGLHGCD